jgi:hypothetical protein
LFATNQAGFFWSKDMSDWKFVYGSFQRNQQMTTMCTSSLGCKRYLILCRFYLEKDHPIWKTDDPKSGQWLRHVDKAMLPTWDPAIFQDDDKKVYMYYLVQAENCRLLV